MDPNGTDPKDQGLTDRRVEAVRASLLDAGVPANRISVGAYGDAQTRRDRRVEVLFASTNGYQSATGYQSSSPSTPDSTASGTNASTGNQGASSISGEQGIQGSTASTGAQN